MGTRSITYFLDEEKEAFASIYRQYDGYPSGHGQDIYKILGSKILVNGYSDAATQTNGIHCAAAMLISGLKDGCGGIYLYGPDAEEQEYVYKIWPEIDGLYMSIRGHYDREYVTKISNFDVQKADRAVDSDEEDETFEDDGIAS